MTNKVACVALVLAACTAQVPGGGDDGGGGGGGGGGSGTVGGPHPFGTHGGYTADGVIFPSNHSRGDLDSATASYYDTWKATYLVPGCAPGQLRVKSTPATDEYTVSEGHGYGMLIAVIMDGHDPDAHATFDGLYAYYDAHRSDVDSGNMAWAQDVDCADIEGADSASDGDLDIAYSLLLADREWGSTGAIDYASAAQRIITSILAHDVHPTAASILVGDWASDPTDDHYTGTRPSDFMTNHFRHFGDRGAAVVEHTYALIDALQTTAAPTTGLLPDFAIDATGTAPQPAPANWLESADDGHYSYNACRTPWRIGTDYLMAGEPRAQAAVRKINAFIRGATNDTPSRIVDGYTLTGTKIGTDAEISFVAPFAVGAMIEPETGTNQPWLDALWDQMANAPIDEYFGDTLKMLAMITASGNWWTP
jgi:endo-1,4-beta-D-glucanase Y|nr:glycosyl hydrolase family 8 [Kofleriaceae bacterium]